MKKSTFIVALSLVGLAAIQTNGLKAQIALSMADMPANGDKFVVINDSNDNTLSPSPMGASVTWNYSAIKTTTVDTLNCVLPGSTPYAGFFPASNIAIKYSLPGGPQYAYVNSAAGALNLWGIEEPILLTHVSIQFKPQPQKLYSFPENFNSAWNGMYTYRFQIHDTSSTYDSIRQLSFVQYHDTIDSWGNCTTPFGTYGVLRDQTIQRTLDSTFGQLRSDSSWHFLFRGFSGDTSYSWTANGLGFTLLSMHMKNGKVHYASWLKGNGTGINEVTDNAGSLVYPNPAQIVLNIKLATCQTGFVKIMDVTGREVSTSQFTDKMASINTSRFANGIYFYQVFDKSSNLIDRGKFSVAK
jgi:hypothetical protein